MNVVPKILVQDDISNLATKVSKLELENEKLREELFSKDKEVYKL